MFSRYSGAFPEDGPADGDDDVDPADLATLVAAFVTIWP
jgi:hypothetical protein